jgi:hypothetical protein
MNRASITLIAFALASSGCAIFSALSGGEAAAIAQRANMDKYDVESIDLAMEGTEGTLCPGTSTAFTVLATARDKKKGGSITLETAREGETGKSNKGKMDLTEFAMEGRGGRVERGVFHTTSDWWTTLKGYDIRARLRTDTSKVIEKHFDPSYACIRGIGSGGAEGPSGEPGMPGAEGGGSGGNGGPGGAGGPGPRITAYATIVRTPKYERVGLVKVIGDVEDMKLFDLSTGITVIAVGGSGGYGGVGGDGGPGSDPQGPGGAGGHGGEGGIGGDGGEVSIVIDDRYPELADAIGADVSGGEAGPGGDGGLGGAGGPAPEKACDDCEEPPPGPDGAPGTGGPGGAAAGRPGRSALAAGDVLAVFADLPPGIALRDDPRPTAAAPPAAAPAPPPPRKRRR